MKFFNQKQCDKAMDVFFSLDKSERFPLWLTLHVLLCEECRTKVRLLTIAERTLQNDAISRLTISTATLEEIEARLDITETEIKNISTKNWIVGGVFVIATILLSAIFTSSLVSDAMMLMAIYLTMGCFVALYCGLFVAGNIDFFIKQNEKIRALNASISN